MMALTKILLIVVNILFLVCAVILITIGATTLVGKHSLSDTCNLINIETDEDVFGGIKSLMKDIHNSSYVLIVCGAFLCVIGFTGLFSAFKPQMSIHAMICLFLFILIVVQVITALLIAVDRLQVTSRKNIESFATQYEHTMEKKKLTLILDLYQISDECCGLYTPNDYNSFNKWKEGLNVTDIESTIVPRTCCSQENSKLDYVVLQNNGTCPNGSMEKGCIQPAVDNIKFFSKQVIGALIGVAVIELIGLVAMVIVVVTLRKSEYKEM